MKDGSFKIANVNTFVDIFVISGVCKMSGRSVSVYTDTSASHEYLCTLIQNGHEFCKLFIKRPQTAMFSIYLFNYPHELLMTSLINIISNHNMFCLL